MFVAQSSAAAAPTGPQPPTLIATTSVAGTGSTGTMPTHAIGDQLIAAVFLPTTTVPTPAGWTLISSNTSTNALAVYVKRAVSSSTTHPTFTAATRVNVQSWRGAGALAAGTAGQNALTGATINYAAFNALKTDGTSYALRFGCATSTTNILSNVPASHTLIGGVAAGLVAMQVTSALTANIALATQSLSSSQEWESVGAELLSSDTTTNPAIMGSITSLTTTVAIPEHAIGDLIVITASRASTTQSSKPVASGTVPAWTDIDAATGTNARSIRSAYFVATAANHTSGTWTNATQMTATVIRGQHSTPIGGHAVQNNASSTSSVAPSITLTNTDGSSIILAVYANGFTANPPSGYAQVNNLSGTSFVNAKSVTTSVSTATVTLLFASTSSATQIEIRQH